jgi:archaellum component FlaF (FlaF/FlaG flagellin family)
MKKLILLSAFFLLLSTLYSFSQEQFNKVDDILEVPTMRNVFQVADTGYVMVGGSTHNYKVKIDVNYYDSLGDFVWNKSYGDDTISYFHGVENACIKTEGVYFSSFQKWR